MKYTVNTDYFKNIDTEEKAYWLGFIFADGCINQKFSKNGNIKSMNLEIVLQAKDEKHLVKFVKSLQSTHPIKYKSVGNGAYRVYITSTEICRDLIKLGCTPRKSLTVKFPRLDSHLIKHFIRGYSDGNATISTRTRYILSSGSYAFLEYVQTHFIEELKVTRVTLRKDSRNNNIQYEKSKSDTLKILDYLYSNATVYLDRKYNKAIAYLKGNL